MAMGIRACKSCGLEFSPAWNNSVRCSPCQVIYRKEYVIEHEKKRAAHIRTTWTDEQRRKLYRIQAGCKKARIKAMSPEELLEWRKKCAKIDHAHKVRKMSKMSPSELKEYKAKQSRQRSESMKRQLEKMSPEERKAFHLIRSRKYRAKHHAFKFLSNMAKMGAAVKAIACSTQDNLHLGEKC